ncbi:hypothetical protein C8R44DRAFT_602076, partial [Mycena epipterygia]
GELEHRRVKWFYACTNKNNAVRQMTRLEHRDQALLRIKRGLRPALNFEESEALPYTSPEIHHYISPSRNHHFHLTTWLAENAEDPAVKDFLPRLQDHLLGQLSHPNWSAEDEQFSPQECWRLLIHDDRIYCHKVLRVNYTSYDVRREQDSMNPRTHSDIMMLAPDSEDPNSHLFVYA